MKKASPSAGIIAADFNPLSQAREYARGGAHALSVLTDEKYFHGHLAYLRQIREQVELPLLRKDFILHELQVYESVVAGADAILLIVASLDDATAARSSTTAPRPASSTCSWRCTTCAEMDRALELGADMIGINNRNLKTFEVDLATTETLAEEIPNDTVAISESGITHGRGRPPRPRRRHQRRPRRRNPHARQERAGEDCGSCCFETRRQGLFTLRTEEGGFPSLSLPAFSGPLKGWRSLAQGWPAGLPWETFSPGPTLKELDRSPGAALMQLFQSWNRLKSPRVGLLANPGLKEGNPAGVAKITGVSVNRP